MLTGLDGQEEVRTPNASHDDVVKLGGDKEDPRLATSMQYVE